MTKRRSLPARGPFAASDVLIDMRMFHAAIIVLAGSRFGGAQPPLKSAEQVLDRYKQALGGVDAIKKVQCVTMHGEAEVPGLAAPLKFISYSKPFKSLQKVTMPDGSEQVSGFDGAVSWSIDSHGARIDRDTPVEALRRDADLQYALHQPDYFEKFELAGVKDFDGRPCYWLHGTTHWGKDNNQFYDVKTGLLAGYRFQVDTKSTAEATLLFHDYKSFGGPLVATKMVSSSGNRTQTIVYKSVSYEPLSDSLFELPAAVKALLN